MKLILFIGTRILNDLICGSEGGNDVVHGRLPIPIIKLDLGSEYLDLGSEYLYLGSEYLS